MIYPEVCEGVFLARPNRFIARVELGGEEITVHVKNTGRCRELLKPGVRVVCPGLLGKGERPPMTSSASTRTIPACSISTVRPPIR